MITSCVKQHNGVPTLFVNDKPLTGMAYITYFNDRNHYKDFAQAGYRLFSFATYFGDQTISERSHIPPFSEGLFTIKGKENFAPFDQEVQRTLDACPDALIFPRVNMSLPRWWELENPEECNDKGWWGAPLCPKRLCFSSQKWREQTEIFLRKFIQHVEASPYKDHIISYQIACGNTEEWFPFDWFGGEGLRSREAFLKAGGDLNDLPSFRIFLSQEIASGITYFAHVAKEETQHRLAIGSFYGYTLECPGWGCGHMALQTVLNCPDVDFLCSPSSYSFGREPGYDWGCITALDSLQLHGKLYFAEMDIRTHLSKQIAQCRPMGCLPGTYEEPIWFGPKDPRVTQGVLRLTAGRQLTHGHNSWWFDMWGGWYDSPEMMADMKSLHDLCTEMQETPHRENLAELAVFVDETSYAQYDKNMDPVCRRISYANRRPLGLSGAPYAIFEVTDAPRVMDRYKACIFFIPAPTEKMTKAVALCEKMGLPFLCVTPEQPDLTISQIRLLNLKANIHCWIDSDDVLFVCDGLIMIHASTAGNKTIHLPRQRKITPRMPDAPSFESREIHVTLQQYETRFFRLEE